MKKGSNDIKKSKKKIPDERNSHNVPITKLSETVSSQEIEESSIRYNMERRKKEIKEQLLILQKEIDQVRKCNSYIDFSPVEKEMKTLWRISEK